MHARSPERPDRSLRQRFRYETLTAELKVGMYHTGLSLSDGTHRAHRLGQLAPSSGKRYARGASRSSFHHAITDVGLRVSGRSCARKPLPRQHSTPRLAARPHPRSSLWRPPSRAPLLISSRVAPRRELWMPPQTRTQTRTIQPTSPRLNDLARRTSSMTGLCTLLFRHATILGPLRPQPRRRRTSLPRPPSTRLPVSSHRCPRRPPMGPSSLPKRLRSPPATRTVQPQDRSQPTRPPRAACLREPCRPASDCSPLNRILSLLRIVPHTSRSRMRT